MPLSRSTLLLAGESSSQSDADPWKRMQLQGSRTGTVSSEWDGQGLPAGHKRGTLAYNPVVKTLVFK